MIVKDQKLDFFALLSEWFDFAMEPPKKPEGLALFE